MKKKFKLSKRKTIFIIAWVALMVAVLASIFIVGIPTTDKPESIKELMKDAVLHESNKVSFLGLEVNPSVISAYLVTGILLLGALLIRVFAIPRFKYVPGKFQILIEKLVEFFSGMARDNSSHKPGFVGAYIFSAGVYVCFSTLFELSGLQWVSTHELPIALPAPLADINAAIAMGFTSFFVILIAGTVTNGIKGAFRVLKDFSLPISMSFRLFGALLSGLLVTELVYYYAALSFVLPVIVGVLFTILHALIQAYVLSTLVSIFYGEAVEPPKPRKEKIRKKKKIESQVESI